MNAPQPALPIRLTQFSHGGGCGCKIAPAVLRDILADTPFASHVSAAYPDLLVGIEHGDDAAVYRLNDEQAIVATTDFFMPIVDDPFEFGRIAATNALSDVYAMGGKPLFALAIVGMPIGKLPNDVIRQILAGGEAVCKAAGVPIAGGHSIDAPEPIYGLVGIGVVNPRKVKQNAGGQAGHVTGASQRNWASYGSEVQLADGIADWQRALLTDPQTSGGLLVSCAPEARDAVLEIFRRHDFAHATEIGRLAAGSNVSIAA
jgi:selenophosphate synthase